MAISSSSADCLKLLHNVVNNFTGHWAGNQLFRFNLWAANSAALAHGRASMDHRLENNPELQLMMVESLDLLKTHLIDLSMVHGDGDYLTNSLDDLTIRDESADPMSERPSSPQFGSSSSSSISSSSSSPSTSFAIPEAAPISSARQSFLSKIQKAIDEALDRLFRLSAMIRKAAIHNRHAKAATFVEFDADGGNLTTMFKNLATQVVKHVFPHANEDLQERLAETVSLRQRQFAYARKHHQDKYTMKDISIPSDRPAAQPLRITGRRLIELQSGGSIIDEPSKKRKFGTLSEVPTQSSASAVDPERAPKRFLTSIPSVSSAGRTKIELNKLVLPRPPEVRPGSKEFECPFCLIVQPESIAQEKNWRRHVIRDIEPYVCVLDNCPRPYALFGSRRDWVLHIESEHSKPKWACTAGGHEDDLVFDSTEDFEDHMHLNHSEGFEEAELQALTASSLVLERATGISNVCPLCQGSLDDITSATSDGFLNHISEELLSLAMFSTRWMNDDKSVDQNGSVEISSIGAILRSNAELDEKLPWSLWGVTLPLTFAESLPEVPQSDTTPPDPEWISWMRSNSEDPTWHQLWGYVLEKTLFEYEGHNEDTLLTGFISLYYERKNEASFPDPFRDVLTGFTGQFTSEEVQNFKLSTPDDVLAIINKIQDRQPRQKRLKNLARAVPFLEVMEEYGKAIEVFINSTSIMCFVWGPMNLCLQIASVLDEAIDTILDAYKKLAEKIPFLSQYQQFLTSSPHILDILVLIFDEILKFHQTALRFLRIQAWTLVFQSLWEDFGARFANILNSLSGYGILIKNQANMTQSGKASNTRANDRSMFDSMEHDNHSRMLLNVHNWLSSVNPKLDQEGLQNLRTNYPSIGRWILGDSKVKAWMDPQNSTVPILWLNGIPGVGKTTLASVIIEESLKIPSLHVIYFYCSSFDDQKQSFLSIARAFLTQLVDQNPILLPYLHDKCLASGEESLNSYAQSTKLLQTSLEIMLRAYIVIDGIDKCEVPERERIITFFTSVIENDPVPGRLRSLFVSRDSVDIKKLLLNASVVRLTEDHHELDMKRYAFEWSLRIRHKFGLQKDGQEHIVLLVCDRSQGMFLFARLVLANLYNQKSQADLYKELAPGTFPRGIEELYSRIVDQINNKTNEYDFITTQRLFGLLCCFKRTPKLNEIQGIFSLNVDDGSVDFDRGRIDILKSCGSLVTTGPRDSVEFVHSTARNYLIHNNHIKPFAEEQKLAAFCLKYLTLRCFDPKLSDNELQAYLINGNYVILYYAVVYWVDHVESVIQSPDLNALSIGQFNFGLAMEKFCIVYGRDVETNYISEGVDMKDRYFRDTEYFETMVRLLAKERKSRENGESVTTLGELGKIVARIRIILEDLDQSNTLAVDLRARLKVYYGDNWYKCTYYNCPYFFEGFPLPSQRNDHVNLHDRPFQGNDRLTFKSLGWADNDLFKNYKFTVSKGQEPYFKLLPGAVVSNETPAIIYLDQPDNPRKNTFPCCYPLGCPMKKDIDPLIRAADLERHYMYVHGGADPKMGFYCDFKACDRNKIPFTRKDHFRDHVRDFHKEDIGCARRRKKMSDKQWEEAQENWAQERKIYANYWRCAGCLARNIVAEVGWECSSCKKLCEPERQAAREKLRQKDKNKSDEQQYKCTTCSISGWPGFIENGAGSWIECPSCSTTTSSSMNHQDQCATFGITGWPSFIENGAGS